MLSGESSIEESVELDRNYPRVSERYFTNYYFIPNNKSKVDEDTEKSQEEKEIELPQKDKENSEEISKGDINGCEEGAENLHNPGNFGHTCVKLHTNKICIITLSHRHPVLAEKKTITKVDFDVGKVNRLDNQVSGKGKRGAQRIGLRSPVCHVSCTDGTQYTVLAGVHGKLIEVNERLVSNPELLSQHPESEGYLAIVLAPLRNGEFMKSKLVSKEEYEAMEF